MPEILQAVLVCGLVTYAIVFVIKYTDGPFDVFQNFRLRVGVDTIINHYETSNGLVIRSEEIADNEYPPTFFAKLLSCFWCSSMWLAVVIVSLYLPSFALPVVAFPFVWLASVGLSGFLYEVSED